MTQKTTMDINATSLYEGELASGRWVDFMLYKAYYIIGYYVEQLSMLLLET